MNTHSRVINPHSSRPDAPRTFMPPADVDALRQQAETRVNNTARPVNHRADPSPQEVQQLVHELQVHQIELELQNDELRQSHLTLEGERGRYFELFDLAPVGYVTVGSDGLILDANLTFATLLGVHRKALGQRPLHAFVAKEDQDRLYLLCRQLRETGVPQSSEVRMNCAGGRQLWVHLTATTTTDAEGIGALRVVLSDISALKSIERQLDHLSHQAHFDPLTDLPNRLLQADRLHQAMAQTRRTGQGLAVVYIDLDGFKAINDQFGHDTGDQMLVAVSGNMQQVLREGDTLARLGGDEFAALLINTGNILACASLLERLLAAAAKPIPLKDELLQVSASLGVTFYPQAKEVNGAHLMRQADQAMYLAKQTGKNRYQVFVPAAQEVFQHGWAADQKVRKSAAVNRASLP